MLQFPQYPGRLQGGLLLAEAEHGRTRPGHVMVGLRLPDSRHGQQNHAGGQQHVEQQSHSAGKVNVVKWELKAWVKLWLYWTDIDVGYRTHINHILY